MLKNPRSPGSLLSRGALVVVAAFLAITACQVADTSAPARPHEGGISAAPPLFDRGGQPAQRGAAAAVAHAAICTRRRADTSSAVFGPSGGVLVVGRSTLYIPGGALRDTVTITGTVRDDSTSTVDFEPSGLQFRKPLGLSLDATNCALGSGAHAVDYVAPDGTVLETIPAVYDPQRKTVTAPISHFSGYAIAF